MHYMLVKIINKNVKKILLSYIYHTLNLSLFCISLLLAFCLKCTSFRISFGQILLVMHCSKDSDSNFSFCICLSQLSCLTSEHADKKVQVICQRWDIQTLHRNLYPSPTP